MASAGQVARQVDLPLPLHSFSHLYLHTALAHSPCTAHARHLHRPHPPPPPAPQPAPHPPPPHRHTTLRCPGVRRDGGWRDEVGAGHVQMGGRQFVTDNGREDLLLPPPSPGWPALHCGALRATYPLPASSTCHGRRKAEEGREGGKKDMVVGRTNMAEKQAAGWVGHLGSDSTGQACPGSGMVTPWHGRRRRAISPVCLTSSAPPLSITATFSPLPHTPPLPHTLPWDGRTEGRDGSSVCDMEQRRTDTGHAPGHETTGLGQQRRLAGRRLLACRSKYWRDGTCAGGQPTLLQRLAFLTRQDTARATTYERAPPLLAWRRAAFCASGLYIHTP